MVRHNRWIASSVVDELLGWLLQTHVWILDCYNGQLVGRLAVFRCVKRLSGKRREEELKSPMRGFCGCLRASSQSRSFGNFLFTIPFIPLYIYIGWESMVESRCRDFFLINFKILLNFYLYKKVIIWKEKYIFFSFFFFIHSSFFFPSRIYKF